MRSMIQKRRKNKRTVLAILDGPSYDFRKDTSHLILRELQKRGYRIFLTEISHLSVVETKLLVSTRPSDVLDQPPYFSSSTHEPSLVLEVASFSMIFMRKDPPVDQAYLHATQLLSLVEDRVPILNPPRALREWNEKLVILNFPQWIPKTLISSDPEEIQRFVHLQKRNAILKPLDGFAGRGVEKLQGRRLNTADLARSMTEKGQTPVMAQEFLKAVESGEKRVFMIDGIPLGALLKIPQKNKFLANPDQGASLAQTKLTKKEATLCREVGEFLKKQKVFFAGLDLIEEKLTEINITSPGLVWEWNEVDGQSHEIEIVDAMEEVT